MGAGVTPAHAAGSVHAPGPGLSSPDPTGDSITVDNEVAPANVAGPDADLAPKGAGTPKHAKTPVTVTIPPTSGHYAVGTVNLELVDTSRTDPYLPGHQPRKLMVTLWYPATNTSSHPSTPWLQSLAAAHFLAGEKIAPSAINLPTTAGHTGAPVNPSAGKLPILVYSTGLHSDRSMGTALVEDLASRGYLVVAIDHTSDANEVQFPNGQVIGNTMPTNTYASTNLAVRAADVSFVLNELTKVAKGSNPDVNHTALPTGLLGSPDLSRIGMFGWSLGGAAAATSMLDDPRIDAGADLDGTFYGPVATKGLDRPFLLFSSQGHNRNDDSSWTSFWAHSHGKVLDLKLQGSQHLSFSDNEYLLPQEASVDGVTQAQLTQTLGTIAPDRAIAIERTYLAAYFDQELRHVSSPLLSGPSKAYPEISFVR
ncbi:hydrolase [Streptacidiphilus sp. P02-A3a]|nr:hydrolase [Streptacidiphilus sp. P02-A3a]